MPSLTAVHYHERLECLWNNSVATGHSTIAGRMLDNQGLYGFWESSNTLPVLDACNGHFGYTPDSPNTMVYRESSPYALVPANRHLTLNACFGDQRLSHHTQGALHRWLFRS